MGCKYSILAKNYEDKIWSVGLYTDSLFKAIRVYIRVLFKYELVEFTIRK